MAAAAVCLNSEGLTSLAACFRFRSSHEQQKVAKNYILLITSSSGTVGGHDRANRPLRGLRAAVIQ
jgi:hypothetical protein